MLKLKPAVIAHEDYQNFVLEQLRKHYSGSVLTIVNNDWPIIYKLWITDLSYLTSWLRSSY
ncbi:transposase, partial [Bacillus sp. IITD106]|nr:transposase [Bacillus sp. IITD106]